MWMQDKKPSYEDLQKRVAQLELRLRQIESRDYITKENDAELEALRIDYEIVFRNTNFYVAFYRPNGEIVAYNKIAADEVGYTPDELIGETVWDIFEKSQADLFYSRMQKAMNDGNILKFEELNETSTGTSWYETDYIPVYDEDGELIGCQVLARDIGEKKNAIQKLEYNKELLRSFFEQSNAGIAIANINGKFVDVNTRFAEMLGYTVDELIGMNFADITYDTDLKEEKKYIQQMLNQEIEEYTIEKRYRRKNGEVFWVYLSAKILKDKNGNPIYNVGAIIDIQRLKNSIK